MSDKRKEDYVITPPFRMSFPHLWEPDAFNEGDKKKYSVMAIFYPDDIENNADDKKKWDALCNWVLDTVVTNFGMKFADFQRKSNNRVPFHRGADKADLDGFTPTSVYANLSSLHKPGLIDRDRNPVLDEEQVYPGRWARAAVSVWQYSNKYGNGVSIGLRNIQLLHNDTRLDGRSGTDAADSFAEHPLDEKWLDKKPSEVMGAGTGSDDDAEIPF